MNFLHALVTVLAFSCATGCSGVVWYGFDPDRTTQIRIVDELGEQFVEADGVAGSRYDAIAPASLAATAGHVAYAGRDDDTWWIVVDGARRLRARGVQSVRWEAGGQVLVAVVEDPDGVRVIELEHRDGDWRARSGPPFDSIAKGSIVASDAGCLGYVGFRGRDARVVTDGAMGPAFDAVASLQVSRTCTPSYAARSGEVAWLVRDGLRVGPFEDIAEVSANASGSRVIALVREDGAWHADDAGARSEGYDVIGDVTISPNGWTVAFRAERDGASFVVVDGVESGPFDAVKPGTLRLMGPGGAVAFVSGTDREERVFAGEFASGAFASIEELAASPTGTVGFIAREGEGHQVVVDGVVLGSWEWAGDLTLGERDEPLFLARQAARDVVHAGSATHAFDRVLRGSLRFGPDGATWGALAVVDGALTLVHAKGIGPRVDFEELAGEILRHRAPELQSAWIDRWMSAELARVSKRSEPP